MSRPPKLDDALIDVWLKEHPRWVKKDRHLVLEVPVSYPLGAALVAASVPLVEELDHHPFITVGYDHLVVELWTHDKDGITQLDFTVAEFVDSFLAARS